MRIGIIGGTGSMGKGFALRWCPRHDIIIGSRNAGRAAQAAVGYRALAEEHHGTIMGTITGDGNAAVARSCDVLILSIPYENIDTVCPEILAAAGEGCVIVSPIVPMTKTDAGFEFIPMMDGRKSAHRLVAAHARNPGMVVSAFHVISEKKLANPRLNLNYDIFVCGDDPGAVGIVEGLISEIEGLRPLKLGPGSLAYMAEISTPLLLNAMIRNKIRNPGIKIV